MIKCFWFDGTKTEDNLTQNVRKVTNINGNVNSMNDNSHLRSPKLYPVQFLVALA